MRFKVFMATKIQVPYCQATWSSEISVTYHITKQSQLRRPWLAQSL